MISKDKVMLIANLCKLRFDEKELSSMIKQLSNIVDMTQRLEKINSQDEESVTCFTEVKTRMRKDEIKQETLTDELLANVPEPSATIAKTLKYFVVPKVIE